MEEYECLHCNFSGNYMEVALHIATEHDEVVHVPLKFIRR